MTGLDMRGYANVVRRKVSNGKNPMKSPGVLHVDLEKLSAIIHVLEEKVRKSMFQGTLIPEVFRWIENAKQVEKQAKQVFPSQQNNETSRSLNLKIIYFVETSPINDAGLINTREFHRGCLPLPKKEKYSQGIADKKPFPERVVVEVESTPYRPQSEIEEICIDDTDDVVKTLGEGTEGGLLILDPLQEDSEELLPFSRNEDMFGGRIETSEQGSRGRSIASDPKEEHQQGDFTLEPSFAAESALPQEIKLEEIEMSPTDLTDPWQEDRDIDSPTEVERAPAAAQSSQGISFPYSVTLSVGGVLSDYVDVEFESLHGLSSKNRPQHENRELVSCDFTSDSDDYRILMREKIGEVEAKQSYIEGGVSSSKIPEHLILQKGGCRLTSPPTEKEWRQSSVMILRDNALTFLPSQPDCPNLVLLFLQRNTRLRKIPDSFFSLMRWLTFLDISDSRIRSLPSSLFRLEKLQVLKSRNSICVGMIPKDIGLMEGLEVLDLSGTQLYNLPDEIENLIHLRQLSLTFYGTDDERHNDDDSFFLSPNVISRLQSLEELSIDVHPEEKRWRRNVEDLVRDLVYLDRLRYLDFYFPEVELLKHFTDTGEAWENIRSNKFKFVVGQNVKRIVDRVPHEVEVKFNEYSRSLKFVNGRNVDEAVKNVAKYTTALYLDHHLDMCSLSEMGITTSEEIEFCTIRECPALEFITNDDVGEPAYPSLEYLGMYYLWKLKSIFRISPVEGSFSCLKSLVIDACPLLEFIMSEPMVSCLYSLEELVVVSCGRVKEIVKKTDEEQVEEMVTMKIPMFPRLAILKLQYLPQLHSFWWKMGGAGSVYPLPNGSFKSLHSAAVQSCRKLDLESLKSIKKDFEIVSDIRNIQIQ